MGSETAPQDEEVNTRTVYGRALSALVATQADWGAISALHDAERHAIETWAAKAKVDLDKPDAQARSKLLQVANTAVLGVALGSTDPKSEDRQGNLGLLSPRLYEIEYEGPLKDNLSEHGLTERQVENSLHFPDAYQHLSPPSDFRQDTELFSIFVQLLNKAEVAGRTASPEWCLVLGNRVGRKFIARDGYRIIHRMINDVSNEPPETPIQLFRAFCAAFGCELIVDGKPIGKFLVYERVNGVSKLDARFPPDHKVLITALAKSSGHITELAFGYAIDLTVYASALGANGT